MMITKLKKALTWRRLEKGMEIYTFGKSIFYYRETSIEDSRKVFFESFREPRLLVRACPLEIICVDERLKYFPDRKKVQTNYTRFSIGMYLFRVHNGDTRKMCEIYSKLIIKTPEQRHDGFFIANFEPLF